MPARPAPADFDQGYNHYGYAVQPVVVRYGQPSTRNFVTIREEPSLLRPADLHFSVDEENGVTVVRGPLAH